MKIQLTSSFVALLAALFIQPGAYADIKSGSGKPATATGEVVDCFYEQNAGHAACQQFRGSENKTAAKDAPIPDGRVVHRRDKNPMVSGTP